MLNFLILSYHSGLKIGSQYFAGTSKVHQSAQTHITHSIHVWYIYLHFPYFTLRNNQMQVNIPYMDGMGYFTNRDFPEIAGGFFPFPKKLLPQLVAKSVGCVFGHICTFSQVSCPQDSRGGIGG